MTARPHAKRDLRVSRWWRITLLVAVVFLLITGGLTARQYFRFSTAAGLVGHTYQVLAAIDRVHTGLLDAETGAHGFLLTGSVPFLAPYNDAAPRIMDAANELTTLVQDNPVQVERAVSLARISRARLGELQSAVSDYQAGRTREALDRIASGVGQRLMDEARALEAQLKDTEDDLLDQRASTARLARRAALIFAILCLSIAGSLAFVAVAVDRDFERRRVALAIESAGRESAELSARATSQELRRSESFNRSVLESSGDCIQVLDATGRLVSTNGPGLRLLEIDDAAAVTGQPWIDQWGENRTLAREAYTAAAAGGQSRFQALRQTRSGDDRWWDVILTPIRSADDSVANVVCIARDVTDQKRNEVEKEHLLASERSARSEAEHAAHVKDEFLATLSHELRTPLNAIVGWIGVLKQDKSQETMSKALDVIDRNSRRQSQMIDDLLDVSRIVSGKLPLEVRRVDMAAVIEEALTSAQPAADAKGIRLIKVLGSAAVIQGDPGRLQQIVWNLVSNAIKFTNRGGLVHVTLRKVGSHVVLDVGDTGQGIAPDVLPQVFQRFRQGDSSSTRRHGGLGLGLAIVKNLVEMHGGSVEASSEGAGKGALFTVRLPLALAGVAADLEPADPALRYGVTLNGIVAMIVDDEEDARELLERLLADAGAQVSACGSAREALDSLARGFKPDVIISDIGMPEQDGYEFMQHLRQMGGPTSSVPAAALTALARVEDRKRALLAGFQTHLAKPVDPGELVATVASLARRTGRM